MHARLSFIAAIAAGTLALGACASSSHPGAATHNRGQDVVQIAAHTGFGAITVSGHGTIEGKPDTLTVSLGVSVKRPTASAAISDMESRAQALIDQLVASGIVKSDIQTTQVSVYPNYDSHEHLTGFTASNQVTAKLHRMDRAGAVIDAAARAAGDAITLDGVTFSIEDSNQLVRAARKQAVQKAADQARQLAAAAGVHLGRIKSIDETSQTPPSPVTYDGVRVALAKATSVPIEPGTQSLSLDVKVVYEIAQ